MGLFRRIGRAFRRVTRRVGGFVKNGLKLVTKPLANIIKPFTGIIGNVLNKLPFGNVIKARHVPDMKIPRCSTESKRPFDVIQ